MADNIFDLACDYLGEYVGVNSEVINCVTSINGQRLEVLEDILYYYTGYITFDQVIDLNDSYEREQFEDLYNYYGNEEEEEEN